MFEILEKLPVIPGWGRGVCWAGAGLAGQKPHQHVCRRGHLLSAHREAEQGGAEAAPSSAGAHRRRDYYHGGAGGGADRQPGLRGLGLPGAAGELPGTDLPGLYGPVGAGGPGGPGALQLAGCPAGQGTEKVGAANGRPLATVRCIPLAAG